MVTWTAVSKSLKCKDGNKKVAIPWKDGRSLPNKILKNYRRLYQQRKNMWTKKGTDSGCFAIIHFDKSTTKVNIVYDGFFFVFSFGVSFHEHSRITEMQGKWEDIPLTPQFHFHLLYSHLDFSRAITADSSPLHIANSQTQTGNLRLPGASR